MKKLCLVIYLYFCFTSSAYAYLDPGTGSVILSAIVAGIVAVKSYWFLILNKIKNIFKKKTPKKKRIKHLKIDYYKFF